MNNVAIFDNGYSFELGTEGKIIPKLPAGIYNAVQGAFGRRFFEPADIVTDKLVPVKTKNTVDVLNDISVFLKDETKTAFKDYEMLYRRGILLYGPPGTGKTSAVIQICRHFVKKHNGIVLLEFPYEDIDTWIKDLRSKDPGRLVVLVMEELDNRLRHHEYSILSLLDGENSVDNLIVLATTNYIDEIPPRIKNRPSRFSLVKEIGYPDMETRLNFLQAKILPKHQELVNVKQLAEKTDGFSVDHLKDLIVSLFCFNIPQDEAISKLREMIKNGEKDDEDF
jgi:DNA polymerase III delta prime subunit